MPTLTDVAEARPATPAAPYTVHVFDGVVQKEPAVTTAGRRLL